MPAAPYRVPTRVLAWTAAAGLLLFVLVSADVLAGGLASGLDVRIDAWVVARLGPDLRRTAVSGLAWPGSAAGATVATVAAAAVLLWRRAWRAAVVLVAGSVGSGILVNALKAWFARPYPISPVPATWGHAYPSGHTMGAVVPWGLALGLVCACMPMTQRLRAGLFGAWIGVVAVVGVQRVVIRVHWATDVVASLGLGAALVALGLLVHAAWLARVARRA